MMRINLRACFWMTALTAFIIAVGCLPTTAHALVHHSRSYTKRMIRVEAKRAHYGPKNTAALLWIAKRESGYRNWAVSSGGCYGVFQLSRGMARGHHWSSARWNTRRAIRYIKHRYGSPLGAKRFWLAHRWY